MKTNAHMELDMKDFFAIYDTLLAGIDSEETVSAAISGGGGLRHCDDRGGR